LVADYAEGSNSDGLINEYQAFRHVERVAVMLQNDPVRTFASWWRCVVAFVEDMEW
jgi:hypothetical protein